MWSVSGLLLTGRAGAGKTSIVKAVAKSVQDNPKAYTCTTYRNIPGDLALTVSYRHHRHILCGCLALRKETNTRCQSPFQVLV